MYRAPTLLLALLVVLDQRGADAIALVDHDCYTDLDADAESLLCEESGITGTIPPSIADFPSLTKVWLQRNQLTGTIPPELTQLADLTALSLSDNQLEGTLDGAFIAKWHTEKPPDGDAGPPQPGDLRCDIDRNDPGFDLPTDVSALVDFEGIYLAEGIRGTIPAEWGTLTNLKELVLGAQLTGEIPDELADLTSLTYFNVATCDPREEGHENHNPEYCNKLTGETPEWCLETGRTCKGISDYDCSGFENSVPRMDARSCKACPENSGAVFAFWILTLLGMCALFAFVYRHRARLLPPKRKAMAVVLWSHIQVMARQDYLQNTFVRRYSLSGAAFCTAMARILILAHSVLCNPL